MTLVLKRISTEYVDTEDRIRLTGEITGGEVLALWLTLHLLHRLIPICTAGWRDKPATSRWPMFGKKWRSTSQLGAGATGTGTRGCLGPRDAGSQGGPEHRQSRRSACVQRYRWPKGGTAEVAHEAAAAVARNGACSVPQCRMACRGAAGLGREHSLCRLSGKTHGSCRTHRNRQFHFTTP